MDYTVLKEAEYKKVMEIAKSLCQTAFSNEEIAKHTGLTTDQIQELRFEIR